jgi:hypothetical protein
MTTLPYRRRAAECLQSSQETVDPKARSELLTMAMAWADLARWTENGKSNDDTGDDSEHSAVKRIFDHTAA